MSSKTFFKKLKETCRKIDKDISDIKTKMISHHEDDDEEEIFAKRICNIQDKIKTMKVDTSDLRNMLEPKLAHSRDFIKNFRELIAETEESISKKEDYLKQYGYAPVESAPKIPESVEENISTPPKKENEKICTTPNLFDYGIPSYNYTFPNDDIATTPELKKPSPDILTSSTDVITTMTKSRGKTDSTPTLDELSNIGVKAKETPPLPETFIYSFSKETPPLPETYSYSTAKETPPLPEILNHCTAKEMLPLSKHLPYNSAASPSTPKLNL